MMNHSRDENQPDSTQYRTGILDQAYRALNTVKWVARYGLSLNKAMTIRVALLLGATFFLQSSVALSLIFASKLLAGETITIWKFSYQASDKITAIYLAFGSILVVMVLVSVLNFATSIFLRSMGRAAHMSALNTMIDRLDRRSNMDKLDLQSLNRMLYQASLHLGMSVETILRIIQPLLIMAAGTITLMVLDPWLLPIIALLALPIMPVYLRESRRLVQLSEKFFSQSSKNVAQVVSKFVTKTRSQNTIPLGGEKEKIFQNPRILDYFDSFDSFILSSDRMTFVASVYRPIVFCVIIGYMILRTLNDDNPGSNLSIFPILFAVFYLSNGALILVSFSTNLMRFLPNVRLIKDILTEKIDVDLPPKLQALEMTPASQSKVNGKSASKPKKRASRKTKNLPIYLLHASPNLDRTSAAILHKELDNIPLPGIQDSLEPVFIANQFSAPDLSVQWVLTAGQPDLWDDVKKILRSIKYDKAFDALPNGTETIIDAAAWASLNGSARALFRTIPLLWVGEDKVAIVEFDALSGLGQFARDKVISLLRKRPLLVNYNSTKISEGLADKGIIVRPDGRVEVADTEKFYTLVEAIKLDNTASASGGDGTELLF